MKVTLLVKQEIDLKTLHVRAHVRYWEDAVVDGEEDTTGDLIPCKEGDNWCPIIDLETGKILNWKQDVAAVIHYKVCDRGAYTLKDAAGNSVREIEGYVPAIMCPTENGFGDYIIMDINEDGLIQGWDSEPDFGGFLTDGEE